MKKLAIFLCTLFLCTLIGCSTAGEPVPPADSQPEEAAHAFTPEELHLLFVEVFDVAGDIQSQEEAQIAAELSALRESANTLPDDYETLYRSWREGQVTAWETEVEQLKEEYKKIVLSDTDLTAAWDAGRDCYADYMDFDGDDIPELLTMYVDTENNEGTVIVYGKGQYGVLEFEKVHFLINTAGENWVRLFKNDASPLTYLGIYENQGASMSNGRYTYYSLDGGQWGKVDDFERLRYEREDANGVFVGYEWSWTIYPEGSGEFGERITDAQYESMVSGKYTDYQELMSSGAKLTMEHGILPDLLTVKVTVDGDPVELAVAPFVEKGAFMAPVRPVLEAMGVAVYAISAETYKNMGYDLYRELSGPPQVIASTKKQTWCIRTTIGMDDNFVYYHPGDYYAEYGSGEENGPAPRITGGQMFAPITKMVEFFGGKVAWDPAARTLAVTGSVSEEERMSEEEIKSMATFSSKKAISIMESKGYRFFNFGWGRGDYDTFRNGKKYWTFVVLPQGVEFEILPDNNPSWPEAGPTNATYVTVGNDGSISWGEKYYESSI